MSNFVVSARKYRPMRFDDVVGQQHVSQTLKNALRNEQVAHAFLFCGPRGVGKTTCARILAKVLNCENITSDFEPCNECEACQSFNENASFNIHELDAASNNSVEHIRALTEQVRFQPQQGKKKIYIIDEVHMLSQAAFNAFLKTLEEPPPYATFILATTEKHKIIPTILSRCQIFDFKRIQIPEMVTHLENICKEEGLDAEKDALHIIGQKADGALRDALSIFDRIASSVPDKKITYDSVITNLNILDYDYYFKVLDAMLTEDLGQVMLLFDEIINKGFEPDIFINGLAGHLRNLLVCKDTQTIKLLEVGDSVKARYHEQAGLSPMAYLLTALNIANDCDVEYKMARNKRLHVEMAIIKMTYINRAISIANNPQAVVSQEKKTPDLSTLPVNGASTTSNTKPIAHKPEIETTSDEREAIPGNNSNSQATNHQSPITPQKLGGGSLLSKIEAEVKKEEEEPEEKLDLLTAENLAKAWEDFTNNIQSPSVKSQFKNAGVELVEDEVRITVSSEMAKGSMQTESGLMPFLREQLGSKTIRMTYGIDSSLRKEIEKPDVPLPMTPMEKYKKMVEKNGNLEDLRKRFDLTFED